MNKKISNKIFCITIFFILVASTIFSALPIPASAATTKTVFNPDMPLLWTTGVGTLLSSPRVADGVLYIGSSDKNVYAFNATTGEKIWNYTTGFYVYGNPCIVGNVVYISSGDKNVYALNATTGEKIWNYTTGSGTSTSAKSSPRVVDGVVYVGSYDKAVYALNATTGEKIWSYTTGGYIQSSPYVVDGVVYVGSGDKNVYALNATTTSVTGEVLWSYTTGSNVYSSPCVVGGVVYIGSNDKNVYAFNATTGEKIWSYTTGGSISTATPCVVNGVVYITSGDKKIYALNATTTSTTGEVLWSYTTSVTTLSTPCVDNGIVYMGSAQPDSKLYAFNATTTSVTGQVLWTYTIAVGAYAAPYVANNILYAGSNLNMYVFGPISNITTIQTCDNSGTDKSTFTTGDDIHFSATGLNVSAVYPLYVFAKNTTWAIGSSFSAITRCPNSATSVTTDSSGKVAVTSIYPQAANGQYYVAADLNADDTYDQDDILINNISVQSMFTCDNTGNRKSIFNPAWSSDGVNWHGGENVYLTAGGLNPSTTYPVYVFIKNESFTTGMAFPPRFYNTAPSVTTDSAGNVASTSIIGPITGGEYYVVLDVNSDGIYDSSDLLINDLAVTLPIISLDSDGNIQKAVYLTPEQLYSLPSYTGVGLPRRNGGYYPLQQLGNYTGIPLSSLCNLVGGMTPSTILRYATVIDNYAGTMTYSQAYENQYIQFNITLGKMYEGTGDNPLTIITGQNPVTMLAYAVNGTNLSSDSSGAGDNDLGGPYRMYVVSNNGTSTSLANDGIAVFGNTLCKFVTSVVLTNAGSFSLSTTNNLGTVKSTFYRHENIYCSATGLNASTTYPVYIVPDQSLWPVRVPFPTRVTGSTTTLTTDSSGRIVTASVYANAQPGQYAIILDKNSNGKYDEADYLITGITVTTDSIQCTLTMLTHGGGTVSPGNQTFPYGTTVNLNAYTTSGLSFAGWSGDTSGTSNTTITMNSDMTITATFTQNSYTLIMKTIGQGTVNPGNQTYLSGTSIDLKAMNAKGWTFSGWSGDTSGTSNTTITMNGNKIITATFTQNSYTLIMKTIGQGTVNPGNQTYLSGTSIDLKAMNAKGWTFSGWSGDTSGTSNTTITMNSDMTITATFTQNTYALIISTTGQGTVSPGSQTYLSGNSVTLQATASSGWTFNGWSGDASGTSTSITITMDSNMSITATFTENPIPSNSPTPTPTPTATTLTPTPTATPTQNSNTTTISATTDSGTTVDLFITGNITSTQMSNVNIATNQTSGITAVSFTVTGQSGATGYGNITIPKSAVHYGTAPLVYIDNQAAETQSYTEDADNYYVYYTLHFSTHQVTIEFTGKEVAATSQWLVCALIAVLIAVIVVVVMVTLRRSKKSKTK